MSRVGTTVGSLSSSSKTSSSAATAPSAPSVSASSSSTVVSSDPFATLSAAAASASPVPVSIPVVTPTKGGSSHLSTSPISPPPPVSAASSSSIRRMETAMDVLQRALQGDPGARSFLDQTCSIYVLDATNLQMPKLFGCWNFLHQAMNEMERTGASSSSSASLKGSTATTTGPAVAMAASSSYGTPQAQLLAQVAVKVARRSNARDKQLVTTCIENYTEKYNHHHHQTTSSTNTASADPMSSSSTTTTTPPQLLQLIPENAQLREIVMGRIAAIAFDPTNYHHIHHHPNNNYHNPVEIQVMEAFHKVLAANAISNGPQSIKHLLCDWIIPSRNTLPQYSLVCILLYLAQEAQALTAPAYTQDMLQQLSVQCMAQLLGPTLKDAVLKKEEEDHRTIAATALRALHAWCAVTDLSLAQVQHICSKVQIHLVEILSDAMYSDSPQVMDALADLLELVVEQHPPKTTNSHSHHHQQQQQQQRRRQQHAEGQQQPRQEEEEEHEELVSTARFHQTRYIMGVLDEASFRANITPQQLYAIESKELGGMIEELASAISLQRYRFIDRQASDDHDVCHSLARIVAAVCVGYSKITMAMDQQQYHNRNNNSNSAIPSTFRHCIPGPGCLDLLVKCASHPSVVICGLVLPIITPVLATEVGLGTHWLPILQRRAIIPHHPDVTSSSGHHVPSLVASDVCYASFEEFVEQFRETVLVDALLACYALNPEYYLASCTAAIEEFCSGDGATEQTSFHLEAALYCLESVAEEALCSEMHTSSTASDSPGNLSGYLERCTAALAKKPMSLMNPLTMKQACHFIRKYDKWYASNHPAGVLDVSADLCLFIFTQCASNFPKEPFSVSVLQECGVAPFSEAAKALESLLCQNPRHFLSNQAIAALGAGWEATFTACNQGGQLLTTADRMNLVRGICHILAALPESQRSTSLMALAMPSLGCLDAMIEQAAGSSQGDPILSAILDRAAAEIMILTAISRAFTDAVSVDTRRERTSDVHAALVEPSLAVIRRAWRSVAAVASMYGYHDSILEALSFFLVECLPTECNDDVSLSLLRELCSLARSIVESHAAKHNEQFFLPAVNFLSQYVKVYGNAINKNSRCSQDGRIASSEVGKFFDETILATLSSMDSILGSTWASAQRQGNGQAAFETKVRPTLEEHHSMESVANAGLPSMWTLLGLCCEHCPYILLHLKLDDSPNALLLRRALDSAVSSLLLEPHLSLSAIKYLESILAHANTPDQDLHFLMEEFNARKPSILYTLLMGCACGIVNVVALPDACRLFQRILISSNYSFDDVRSLVLQALGPEHFLLGSNAQSTVYKICCKLLRNEICLGEFESMMTEISRLHCLENDPITLQQSDAVRRFCSQINDS